MTNKPSLALIPSGYKASKLYSILPNNGDGDFTFSRSSTATRVNKDGLIETVASNIPRLDYSDGGCPSLLLEPQRTNLFLNSDASSVPATGTKTNITFDTNDWLIGLNGNVIFEDNTVNRIYYNGTVLASTQYTLSFYIKTDDGLEPTFGVTSSDIGRVNIGNNSLSLTYELELFSEGIWRVKATGISDTVNLSSNGILKTILNNNIGFKATGFQLEQGDYATSYIPTNGSTATRLRDQCVNNDLDFIIQDEGSVYWEGTIQGEIPILIQLSPDTGNFLNTIYIEYASSVNQLRMRVYANGVLQSFFSTTVQKNTIYKIALGYKENDIVGVVNGTIIGTDSVATIQSGLSNVNIGEFRGFSNELYNGVTVKKALLYDKRLSNEELQELTTI